MSGPDSGTGSLSLELRLPDAVPVGEPVRIELVLRNAGSDPVELFVPGRPPAFDLVVETESGRTVWRRLEGKPIAMALGIVRLAPGEEVTFAHTWRQRDRRGEPVLPGDYVVRGIVEAEGTKLLTTPRGLRIRGD